MGKRFDISVAVRVHVRGTGVNLGPEWKKRWRAGAVQMSAPHFTCGCGWPSTFSSPLSIHPLFLTTLSGCRRCFSARRQDLHTGLSFLLLLLPLPSPKHLAPSLSDEDYLWLVVSIHQFNSETITSTFWKHWQESDAHCVFSWGRSSSAYKKKPLSKDRNILI